MDDATLADEIIDRLNKLIHDPEVRRDIGSLIESRVGCTKATLDHPTIQAEALDSDKHMVRIKPGYEGPAGRFGVLGLLNGLVGTLTVGPKSGWGYITAEFDDSMDLVRFRRTT